MTAAAQIYAADMNAFAAAVLEMRQAPESLMTALRAIHRQV